MSGPHYAADLFPWAEIDPSWTVAGFLDHRKSKKRRDWARVLAGTDQQLSQAYLTFRGTSLCSANFSLPASADAAFALAEVLRDPDDAFAGRIDMDRLRTFYYGFAAALATKE